MHLIYTVGGNFMDSIAAAQLLNYGFIIVIVSLILILVACIFMFLSKRRLARKLTLEYGVAPGKGGRK